MNASKYKQHRKTDLALDRQKLRNCALLCAYAFGSAPGWYGIAHGSIEGFPADYAVINSVPGNIELHQVRAFYLLGNEDYLDELEEIRQAVADYHNDDELPLVTTLTADEIEAARLKVREALLEEAPDDAETWLQELCEEPASDLLGTDWTAAAERVQA